MAAPVIIRRPKLIFQPLDESGDPEGEPIDVSCDVTMIELSPDQTIDTVTTFCGPYRVTGDTIVSATAGGVLTPDTETNWGPLVGTRVQARIYDTASAERYRAFETEVPFDPSLYGANDAGEQTRAWEMELPVLSDVTWVTPDPEA